MPSREEILVELNNRGALQGRQKAAFDELVRRGDIKLPKPVTEDAPADSVGARSFLSQRIDAVPATVEPEFKAVEPTVIDTVTDFLTDVHNQMRHDGGVTRDAFTLMLRKNQITPVFGEDGELVEMRKETDEERNKRIKIERKVRARVLDVPAPGSAAAVTGSIASEIMDPVAWVSGSVGIGTAKALARALKLSAAGTAYEGTAATLEQQVNSGEITDKDAILERAALGGIAAPVLDKALTLAGRAIRKVKGDNVDKFIKDAREARKASEQINKKRFAVMQFDGRQAEKEMRALEKEVRKAQRRGLNTEAALERAMVKRRLAEDSLEEVAEIAGRPVQIFSKVPVDTAASDTIASRAFIKVKDSFVGKAGDATKLGFDKFITPISTRVKNINKPLFQALRRFEMNSHIRTHEMNEVTRPFKEAFQKLSKVDKRVLKRHLLNSDTEAVDRFMSRGNRAELKEGWQTVRSMLDNMYDELKSVGHDVGFVEDYFPRVVTDHTKFTKVLGTEPATQVQRAIQEATTKKGASLTSTEIADVVNKNIRGRAPLGVTAGRTDALKGRSVERIDEELVDLYEDPIQSLQQYINHTVHNLEKRKFFGHGSSQLPKYNANIEDSVGELLAREQAAGNITFKDVEDLRVLLNARFGRGEAAPSKFVQDVKNVFYATTLANPVSTVTQLGDVAISAHINGLARTLQAVFGPRRIRMQDLGLERVAQEFETTTGTAKALDRLLGLAGFKYVDRFGKNTLINASLHKHAGWAKSLKGQQKLREKFQEAFTPAEMDNVIAELRRGEITPNVKFMLWSDLSDAQPIALSEMPQKYLEHPNGRLFYMLKTFTIKQLDIMRRALFEEIEKGNPVKGAANLLKFGMLFTAANASTDQIKNWMQGRDVEWEDSVISNLYKNFGVSEYFTKQVGGGKVTDAVVGLIKPPTNVIDDVIQDAINFGGSMESLEEAKTIRNIPLAGKLYYNWFAGGIEEFEEKQEREEFRE